MSRITRILCGSATALTLAAIGCEDDNHPVIPNLGTIEIDAGPNSIDAPWTLTGPANYAMQGAGDLTLFDLEAGHYTLTWDDVPDRFPPDPSIQSQLLQAGRMLTFAGQYRLDTSLAEPGFVWITPGSFAMGSAASEPERYAGWETQHSVSLTHGFYASQVEVTEQWWNEVMGDSLTTSPLPKVDVSWDMAVQFCNALSQREGLTPAYVIHGSDGNVTWDRAANGYRLPTEAEWEYACRAGTTTAFHNGTNCLSADTESNYDGTSPLAGCPSEVFRDTRGGVGSFPANAWGLHDMHGNVWEWVWDGWRSDYEDLPETDPVHDVGPGSHRVLRGGGWSSVARLCRAASRIYYEPTIATGLFGFRVVRSGS